MPSSKALHWRLLPLRQLPGRMLKLNNQAWVLRIMPQITWEHDMSLWLQMRVDFHRLLMLLHRIYDTIQGIIITIEIEGVMQLKVQGWMQLE